MGKPLDIALMLDEPDLQVWSHIGRSDRLVLCFSGIGRRQGESPGYEFAATATAGGRDHVLFIADPARSWLNAPGLIEEIVELASEHAGRIGAREIVTLGHSMGGFAALAMPAWLPVRVAVGMSPQFSVHPEAAGQDPRWMEYRARIEAFRLRTLAPLLNDETGYFVFHGEHPREAVQREPFPRKPNLHHYYFRKVVHEVPQVLREKRVLSAVVQEAFANRPRRVRMAMAEGGVAAYRRPGPDERPEDAFARDSAAAEAHLGRAGG